MCYAPHPNAANTASSLRAFQSLSDAEAYEMEIGMASVPGAWEIDRQESYDGHLTLVISSAAPSSDLVLAVWRSGSDLQMSTMHGDEQVATEAFRSTEAVLQAIRSLAKPRSPAPRPGGHAYLRLV